MPHTQESLLGRARCALSCGTTDSSFLPFTIKMRRLGTRQVPTKLRRRKGVCVVLKFTLPSPQFLIARIQKNQNYQNLTERRGSTVGKAAFFFLGCCLTPLPLVSLQLIADSIAY